MAGKPGPEPRADQKRSGDEVCVQCRVRPVAVTTSIASRDSQAQPLDRVSSLGDRGLGGEHSGRRTRSKGC